MRSYFLGVDGGQSATTALICDDSGRVLGAGHGGPCNHVGGPEGRAKFTGAISACVTAACRQAGLDPAGVEFESACLGFSGGAEDKQSLLREMVRARRMVVTHDALIALAGATGGAPGVICIAGTGSIAFGRDDRRRQARAGGWGYVFGDEGGGFHLTREALRAALRYEEGWGPPTALREMLLQETGAQSANDLLHLFYTTAFPRPRIASYAKLVNMAALEGDDVALAILLEAARQLAEITAAVSNSLFDAAGHTISYAGGVFQSTILLEEFRVLVHSSTSGSVAAPVHGPAAGALLEALSAAGNQSGISNVPETEK